MSARAHRIGQFLLLLAIFIAIAELLRSSLAPASFDRAMLSVASGAKPDLLSSWDRIDPVIREAFAHGGNVVAKFPNFKPGDPAAENLAGLIYFRAAYLMWPRRMFVADDQTVIRSGAEVLLAHVPSDPDWLTSNDVRAIVEFDLVDSRLVVKVLPIGESRK